VVEIRPDSIRIATPDGEVSLKKRFRICVDWLPAGPRISQCHGDRAGAGYAPARTNPETLESERAGVYLAGVIVAGMHTNEIFIENGRLHGRLIAEAITA